MILQLLQIATDNKITIEELVENGYLEKYLKDPDTDNYYNPINSYVVVNGFNTDTVSYSVTLLGANRGISGAKADKLDDVKTETKTANYSEAEITALSTN